MVKLGIQSWRWRKLQFSCEIQFLVIDREDLVLGRGL